MRQFKAFAGEGVIDSICSLPEVESKLDDIIYQDRYGRDTDRNIIVDQCFVGKKINNHYSFRGNKAFLKLLQPYYEMDLIDEGNSTTIRIESYCSRSLHNLVLGIGIGALVLLLFLMLAAFSESFVLLVSILVLGVVVIDLIAAYVVGFFLVRYYLQNEYKKSFTIIKERLSSFMS
jgi:uncharacterized protein YneF (UPF0154 family)